MSRETMLTNASWRNLIQTAHDTLSDRLAFNHRWAKRSYYLAYSLTFVLMAATVYLGVFLANKTFVYNLDGVVQSYNGLIYLRQWVREIIGSIIAGSPTIPMWDMKIGLGQDVLNVVSFRPINFLSLLFPTRFLELFMVLRFFATLFLGGIAYSSLMRKLLNRYTTAMLLSTYVYLCGGFVLHYMIKQPVFTENLFYLPWVLLGIEKLLRNESPLTSLVSLSLCTAGYFYNAFTIIIASIGYAFLRFYFGKFRHDVATFSKLFTRCSLWVSLSIGIACISLIPNLLLAFSSGRAGGGASVGILYPLEYYASLLSGFVGENQIGTYGYLGFPIIALISIILSFKSKSGIDKAIALGSLILLVSLCLPLTARLFNGFSSTTNRWCYIAMLFVAAACAINLPRIEHMPPHRIRRSALVATAYLSACVVLNLFSNIVDTNAICQAGIGLALFCMYTRSPTAFNRNLVIISTIGTIVVSGFTCYSLTSNSVVDELADTNTVHASATSPASRSVKNDEPVRVDALASSPTEYIDEANYGIGTLSNGLSTFYSYSNEHVAEYSRMLGNAQLHSALIIGGFDQRPGLLSLAATKYMAIRPGQEAYLPPGFSFEYSSNGIDVYRNEYALPLIYSYQSTMPESDFLALSPTQKERALLSYAYLSGDETGRHPELSPEVILAGNEELREAVTATNGKIELTEHGLKVNTPAAIELSLPLKETGELYLTFDSAYYHSLDRSEWVDALLPENPTAADRLAAIRTRQFDRMPTAGFITATSGDIVKKASLLGQGNQYEENPRDIAINMGECSNENTTLTLSFSTPGYYDFSNFSVTLQSTEEYAQAMQELMEHAARNVAISHNEISADIDLDKESIVCVAVPYGAGWHAEVDGTPIEIEVVNGMYMGFKLPKGSHQITLTYQTPGLAIGIVITLGSLLASRLLLMHRKRTLETEGTRTPITERQDR